MKTICPNCDNTRLRCKLADIPNLNARLDVGGEVPAGECSKCGALSYRLWQPENESRRLRLIQFAECTLDTLESEEEWNAETLDTVTSHAFGLKLATQKWVDGELVFKKTKERPGKLNTDKVSLAASHARLQKALGDITRCAKASGPHGTTVYFISDGFFNEAKEALVESRMVPKMPANHNAKLIAAAPAMFEAIKTLVGQADLGEVDLEPNEQAALERARSIIREIEVG